MATAGSGPSVHLRDVAPSDLDRFFEIEQDADAHWRAAFGSDRLGDRAAFDDHWRRTSADPAVVRQTIVWEGSVVGYLVRFDFEGRPSVGYWIGRSYWGRGIATEALREFVRRWPERPLFAGVASDNLASIRVLEKAGFVRIRSNSSFAPARGREIEELTYRLDASARSSTAGPQRPATWAYAGSRSSPSRSPTSTGRRRSTSTPSASACSATTPASPACDGFRSPPRAVRSP